MIQGLLNVMAIERVSQFKYFGHIDDEDNEAERRAFSS